MRTEEEEAVVELLESARDALGSLADACARFGTPPDRMAFIVDARKKPMRIGLPSKKFAGPEGRSSVVYLIPRDELVTTIRQAGDTTLASKIEDGPPEGMGEEAMAAPIAIFREGQSFVVWAGTELELEEGEGELS